VFVCINGDQGIAARRCRSGKRGRRICEIPISELEQVAAHREIGNDILAKIGSENESIITCAAGHRVIARSTRDGVVPGSAGDCIVSAGASNPRIGVDRRKIPAGTVREFDLFKPQFAV